MIAYEAMENANICSSILSTCPVPFMVNIIGFYSFLKDKYYWQQHFDSTMPHLKMHIIHCMGTQTPSTKGTLLENPKFQT